MVAEIAKEKQKQKSQSNKKYVKCEYSDILINTMEHRYMCVLYFLANHANIILNQYINYICFMEQGPQQNAEYASITHKIYAALQ
jgi:hypothetical protein